MAEVARVVLALEAHDVAEEVMHFLDRSGGARVVGTAADDRQLTEAVRQLDPDAVVAHPRSWSLRRFVAPRSSRSTPGNRSRRSAPRSASVLAASTSGRVSVTRWRGRQRRPSRPRTR